MTEFTRRMALTGAASAVAAPAWSQIPASPPDRPRPAYSVGAAFHEPTGQLVVFGGSRGRGAYAGETWRRGDGQWSVQETAGPPARNSPEMVFDNRRGRIVMFGGDTQDGDQTREWGDVWEHDGTVWTAVATGGPARTTFSAAYDAARGRTVVFGGAAQGRVLGDTWLWDGARWSRATGNGPSPRMLAGAAYDAARRQVLLYGGSLGFGPEAPLSDETWLWNGRRWRRLEIPGDPGPRDHLAMAFDPLRRAVILHGGGYDDATRETWACDGARWTRLTDAGPSRRYGRLAWDSRRGRMLLYGGFDRSGASSALWAFEGGVWTET